MEQINTLLTSQQSAILNDFKLEPFLSDFYFTGGTALSEFYLQHRYSDDLDFFTTEEFDPLGLEQLVSRWAKKHGFSYSYRQIEQVFSYDFKFSPDYSLKVDFAVYPYKQVEEVMNIAGLRIDNIKEIAINKTATIGQRTNVKDFVDFYYLSQKFGLYELIELSNRKFKRDYDPILLACDLLKVKKFEFLPRMIKSLSLEELQKYYLYLAKEMGGISVDKVF